MQNRELLFDAVVIYNSDVIAGKKWFRGYNRYQKEDGYEKTIDCFARCIDGAAGRRIGGFCCQYR